MRLIVSTAALLLASASPAWSRESAPLSEGWKFAFGTQDQGKVLSDGFDDGAWQSVSLPHTWNRIGEYRLQRSGATDNRQGQGWYRLSYLAPAAKPGKHFYLDFAAVGSVADVWVNGVHVGSHAGAFSRFRLDVTAAWKPGAHNEIVVKADNSRPAIGSPTQDVIPLGGDFFIHGGLYRGVELITTDEAGIDLLDYGGPGVYARTVAASGSKAMVEVKTRLRNTGQRGHALTGTVSLIDAAGMVLVTAPFRKALAGGAAGEVATTLSLANPHLWNGRKDPYLYAVRIDVRERGRTVDSVIQPLGIRTFKIDPNEGFFLNGKHLSLFGASRHQDRLGKGWALSAADHSSDMAIMAEMGANTVRMAHYQHADEWADAADRTGMVAWAEIPFVNAASLLDGAEASPALTANADQQLKELIRQNYNHPAIMMWSVGNEVDIGARFGKGKLPARSLSLLRHLNALAHAEDPTRPTTFADCCEAGPTGGGDAEMLAGTTDLIGYNRYFGWYYGQPSELGPALDGYHAKHPTVPISISEFGAGGALSQHSDNPQGGVISAFGRPHPEEYQSWYHEESWKQIKGRPYIFASWVWNMFDFASDLRDEGDATDINDKGLVTYDRKVRKDSFYFYQAQLTDKPMLHLNGRRYVDRAYPVADVRGYSNAGPVTLTVNGVAVGKSDCPERVCVWPSVALQPGDNAISATAQTTSGPISDTIHWTAPDARQGMRIDAGDLVGHTGASGRFGSDNFFAGGTPHLLNTAVFRGQTPPPQRVVSGAADPLLYNAWREGEASWRVPLPNGKWRIIVHSFEPDAKLADRSFRISANGVLQAADFAPAKVAGGVLKPADISFEVVVSDGMLTLQFERVSGDPVIAAIEILPSGS